MAKARISLFIICGLAAFQFSGGGHLHSQNFKDQVSFKRFVNGMAALLVRRHDAPTITAICGLKAGGVDDPPGFSGTAHLVEHLMRRLILEPSQAKGLYGELSKEYSKGAGMDPQKVNDLEAKIAALEEQTKEMQLMAAVTFDYVYYFGTFSSSQVELFCRMASGFLKGSLPEGILKEREILLAERRSYWDATGKIGEQIQALTFAGGPYGRPVAGRPQEILAITPAVALKFLKKYYVPNNCLLVFVGDLSSESLFPTIEKHFGNIPRGQEPRASIRPEPPARRERRLVLPAETKPEILMNFIKPPFPHKDDLVSMILGRILTKGDSSRLNSDLIKTRRMAEEVKVSWGPGERYENTFGLSAVPAPGHAPEELETAILGHLESLKQDLVDEAELRRAKDEIADGHGPGMESAPAIAMVVTHYQLILGDWQLGFKMKELCSVVTPNNIREFARRYFIPENRTTILFTKRGPQEVALARGPE